MERVPPTNGTGLTMRWVPVVADHGRVSDALEAPHTLRKRPAA